MMNEVVFEITQWPAGQSLDIVLVNGVSTSIAGVHGGGVGHVIKSFKVNAEHLKKVFKILPEYGVIMKK